MVTKYLQIIQILDSIWDRIGLKIKLKWFYTKSNWILDETFIIIKPCLSKLFAKPYHK